MVAPYERWQYYNENVKTKVQEVNYAANKTKKVAWFVSNCGAKNGRLEYARNLSTFIDVDIYGSCGQKRCPRSSDECNKMLDTDYKFYLAFENSNCKDYITEKFYVNGLEYVCCKSSSRIHSIILFQAQRAAYCDGGTERRL